MKSSKGLCDACSESTRPALFAAREGHLNCLVFACDSLGQASEQDGYSATPLHFSARNGHLDCVKWLVQHNVISPTSVTRGGTTPAHDAAVTGQIECLKYLLDNTKCSLNDRTVEGSTMLHMACRFGRLPMVKWLVGESGVSPNETGINNVTPVHISAAKDHLKCLQWLTSHVRYVPNMETVHGATPTYFAAQEGCLKSLEWLLDRANGNPNIAAKDGMLPIHAAAQAGHLDCIRMLVSRGLATVNEPSKDGGSPVHFAAAGGHVDTLLWLIRNGARVNTKDDCHSTPLHDAAEQGQPATVRLLLEYGGDPKAMDDECFTPLDLAEDSGSSECIYLIKASISGEKIPSNLNAYQPSPRKVKRKAEHVENPGYQQRDFDFLSSPTDIEIQTPKQRRKGRFNFKFFRGNSLFGRRSFSSVEHESSMGRKFKRFKNKSNPVSRNISQSDILSNETPSNIDNEIPHLKDALISSKSPDVIRVVRQTPQTASENPRFTPEARRKSVTSMSKDSSNSSTPELVLPQSTAVKSIGDELSNFKAWAQSQSEHQKAENSLETQAVNKKRIFAVNSPFIENEFEASRSTEQHLEIGRGNVAKSVVPPKQNFLERKGNKSVQDVRPPLIPPKPALTPIELRKLGNRNQVDSDKGEPIDIQNVQLGIDAFVKHKQLSLVDEADEVTHSTSTNRNARSQLDILKENSQPKQAHKLVDADVENQKLLNASYFAEMKQKRLETLEAASLALLGPPLLGQRRVKKIFVGIGNDPGIHCWKVGPTANKVTDITNSVVLNGHLHVLDAYIFLRVSANGPVFHQIHVWKGHLAEWGVYEKTTDLAQELSSSLSGVSQIYKEIQGLESVQFLSYFKSKVLFYHQTTNKPFSQPCLYEISGTHVLRCNQVSISQQQFSPTMMYILIMQKTLYLYIGPQALENLKVRAYNIALELREKEKMTSFLVLDPSQKNETFQSALRVVERQTLKHFTKLYQSVQNSAISVKYYRTVFQAGNRIGYREIRYAPIIFDRNEVILIVSSVRLMVWVGHNLRLQPLDFLSIGQSLLKSSFYPELLPIIVLHEFGEDQLFDQQFPDHERVNLNLSDSEIRDELNVSFFPVPSMHDAGLGRIKVYEINAGGKREQPISEFGHFKSIYCYFVLYSYRREIKFLSLIYVWIGSEVSDSIVRNQEIQLRELQSNTPGDQAVFYIPQGQETDHFLSIFKAKFIIHQDSMVRSSNDNTVSLFRIFSYNLLSIKAVQIEANSSNLLSNSAFVISSPAKSVVWIGQAASQNDRRGAMLIAKELKPQEPLILMEGDENERFWIQLGGKHSYHPFPQEYWPPYNASPLLFHFGKGIKPVFTPIPNYSQKDLHIDAVFILSTSSHLFIWNGSMVETLDSKAIAQDFLLQVTPEKALESLVLVVLIQGAEPSNFTSLFPSWNDNWWKDAHVQLSKILASRPILKQPPPKIAKESAKSPEKPDTDFKIESFHDILSSPIERNTPVSSDKLKSASASSIMIPDTFKVQAEAVKGDLMKEINELDEVLRSFELEAALTKPVAELEKEKRKQTKLEALRRGDFTKFTGKNEQPEDVDTDALIKELDSTLKQVSKNAQMEEHRSRSNSNPDSLQRPRASTDVSAPNLLPYMPASRIASSEAVDSTERRDRTESFVSISGSSTGVPTQLSQVTSPLMPKKGPTVKSYTPGPQRKLAPVRGQLTKTAPEKSPNLTQTQPGIGAWAPSVVTQEGRYKPPKPNDKNIQEISKNIRSNVQAKIAMTKAKVDPGKSGAPTQGSKYLLSLELEATGQIVELVIKRNTTSQNVIYKVVEKCRCKLTPTLSLIEVLTELNLERKLEDHELPLDVVDQWPSNESPNFRFKLVVRDFPDKYSIFGGILSIDEIETSLHDRTLPRLQSELFVNKTNPFDSNNDGWSKEKLEFGMDGIYMWQDSKTLRCISQFSINQVYTFIDNTDANESRFPVPYCFALKQLNSWEKNDFHIFGSENKEISVTWHGYVTIAIFGLKNLYKDWQMMRKQFSELLEMKTTQSGTIFSEKLS